MANKNIARPDALIDGVYDASAVTPEDNTDLPDGVCRAIWVGTTGDVSLILQGGTQLTLHSVIAGMWHPMRASRIRATGTTAQNIRAGY